jgi:hypothetical protein
MQLQRCKRFPHLRVAMAAKRDCACRMGFRRLHNRVKMASCFAQYTVRHSLPVTPPPTPSHHQRDHPSPHLCLYQILYKLYKRVICNRMVCRDCGAARDVYSSHHFAASPEEAVRDVLTAGMDNDCGNMVNPNHTKVPLLVVVHFSLCSLC